MSKKLSVILLEDIDGLGTAGQIKFVNEGYARNFLFPEGKAALADAQAQAAVQQKEKAKRAAAEETLAAVRAQAEKLEGTELTLPAKVKEGEEIFGSITARQIAAALHEQTNLNLTAKDIMLPQPLTSLGSQEVTVRLSRDVESVIRVTVVPDEEAKRD